MQIRQAKKTDLEKILKFMGLKQVSRKNWHISSRKFVLSYITNPHNFFIIAIEDNKVVGTINGELWNDKGFAYVGEIKTLGKNKEDILDQLYHFFLQFCKRKKVTLINTYVKKTKARQIETYKKLGLKKKGDYEYYEKSV